MNIPSQFVFEPRVAPPDPVVLWECPREGCPTACEGPTSYAQYFAEIHWAMHQRYDAAQKDEFSTAFSSAFDMPPNPGQVI